MDWQRILQRWESMFYMEPLQFLCLIIAITTAFLSAKKESVVLLFILYTVSGLAITVFINSILDFEEPRKTIYNQIAILLISFIELTAFAFFFYKTLQIDKIRRKIKFFVIGFLLINIFVVWRITSLEISTTYMKRIAYKTTAFQLILLVLLCMVYYYEILKLKSEENLFKRPSFWITTSLFFYCLTIIPFILITEELESIYKPLVNVFYALHDLTFALIFIALTNAFLCKRPLTT